MSVQLNAAQLLSIARYNRAYAVMKLTLTQDGDGIKIDSVLKAGKSTISKSFALDVEGKLVKGNANHQTHADDLSN